MLFNETKLYLSQSRRKVVVSFMVGLACSLTACKSLIQDVDPGLLPQAEPQLVVHSYISPQDTVLTAVVSTSRTSVGVQSSTNQFDAVSDATVTLSEGGRLVRLLYDPVQAIYRADPKQLPILAGRTYQLTVTVPDGHQTTATTTVPDNVPLSEVQLDTVAGRFGYDVDYTIQLRWQDPALTTNYYSVAGDIEYGSEDYDYNNGSYTPKSYRAVTPISFMFDRNSSPYLTDKQRNGQLITSGRGHIGFNSFGPNGPIVEPPVLTNAYLLNVSKEYYDYHETVLRQQTNGDNPFAEPTLIESNIQGGFGCFGAYNRSIVTKQIK